VRYEHHRTGLSVDNGPSTTPPRQGLGGGHGLDGLRQRIEQAGGTMSAGPTADGWRVEIEVPT
jgi:signal transduction histidine kinase